MKEKVKQYIDLIPEKDIPKWLEVIRKRQKVSKNIFKYITSKYIPFNYMQLNEIFIGLQNGLSEKQIVIYANSTFTWKQMACLRNALECNICINDVKKYAKPEFSAGQMEVFKIALQNGIKIERVMEYIKLGFNDEQLKVIVQFLIEFDEKDLLIISNIRYTAAYMKVIQKYMRLIENKEYLKKYVKMNFTPEQLEYVLTAIYREKYGEEEIKLVANPSFNIYQMQVITESLLIGISLDKIKLYADPKFDDMQMSRIKNALYNKKLSICDVEKYAVPSFNQGQMEVIFSGLERGVNVDIYAKSCYTAKQMYQILHALEINLESERLQVILNPNLTHKQMDIILRAFDYGATIEQINSIIDVNPCALEDYILKLEASKKEQERNELIKLLM